MVLPFADIPRLPKTRYKTASGLKDPKYQDFETLGPHYTWMLRVWGLAQKFGDSTGSVAKGPLMELA